MSILDEDLDRGLMEDALGFNDDVDTGIWIDGEYVDVYDLSNMISDFDYGDYY